MTRKSVIRIIIAAAMGAMLALSGLTLGMWQYWVILALWIVDGINEGIK